MSKFEKWAGLVAVVIAALVSIALCLLAWLAIFSQCWAEAAALFVAGWAVALTADAAWMGLEGYSPAYRAYACVVAKVNGLCK